MPVLAGTDGIRPRAPRGPWTLAGGPDPDFDDVERRSNHRLLTDAGLGGRYRRRHPDRPFADYDEMIRGLGYVWDCPADLTVNVTGYRCAGCGAAQHRGRLTA